MEPPASRRSRERGFTLIELLIVVAIIALIAASAFPMYQRAVVKANKTALVADMTELYKAFMSYRFDHNTFPSDTGAGALNRDTLNPLASGGYFTNAKGLNRKLWNRRVQLYFAPDWRGPNSDFIVVAQAAIDKTLVFYVMHYDFMGLFGYDGVYVLKNGVLLRADQAI